MRLKKIDINEIAKNVKENWVNMDIAVVNEAVIRLAVIKGQYHWHVHEKDDEFFFVYDGEMRLETEGEAFVLKKGEGILVPHDVRHCTSASSKTLVLIVERPSTVRAGD